MWGLAVNFELGNLLWKGDIMAIGGIRGGNPRSTITVGHSGADIVGANGRAIQIAIDALAVRGGGVVQVLPGEYVLEDSLRLRPDVRLVGEAGKTILKRAPLVWSPLKLDADIAQAEITPARIEGWHPGMGVCIWDNKSGWAITEKPLIVTQVVEGKLELNEQLSAERYEANGGRCVNYFPMILGIEADRAAVDGFVVDAAVEDPEGILEGMRNAVVYFWRSRDVVIRNIVTKNGRGDGIILSNASTGALIEDCEASNNDNYGIHPGSHSTKCIIRRCHIHHNGSDGLYICWGIRNSEFVDNKIHHNGLLQYRSGLSIGHKDTDNLIARNHIFENRKYGICFRRKTEGNAAHRATVRDNVIENNGSGPEELADWKKRLEPWEAVGCGIHVCGATRDLVMEGNTIRDTREGAARHQRHAVILRDGVTGAKMAGNKMAGHPDQAVLDRSGGVNQLQMS
jgi:hypothetical protein